MCVMIAHIIIIIIIIMMLIIIIPSVYLVPMLC